MLALVLAAASMVPADVGLVVPAQGDQSVSRSGDRDPATSGPGAAGEQEADWEALTRRDLRAMAAAILATDINAVYPDPVAWRHRFDAALARSERLAGRVRHDAGYRALLQYFAVQFHDAHVFVTFTTQQAVVNWPGLLARYANGRYRIATSRNPAIPEGAIIERCDGKSIARWTRSIAAFEIGPPDTLETTQADAATRLFVDRGSPLRPRPARCTIGGRETVLDWQPIGTAELAPDLARVRGRRNAEVSTRPIGTDGAWVKLGYFYPETPDQAATFLAAIREAEHLRDRRFIVLDVRDNGGGPYNWFMAYLRGLYGPAYADYYATARLHIRGAYRESQTLAAASGGLFDQGEALGQPADPPFEVNGESDSRERDRALGNHEAYWRAAALPHARTAPPPSNPVHGRVYVLTDYGCGSACIGFVDELKLFPGVTQIGLPTYVDNRTGTPIPTALPSGRAQVYAPMMTRDGRIRGDNVPQVPSIRFEGDMMDDRAVEQWVLNDVVGRSVK